MIVQCGSIDEFVAELAVEAAAQNVWRKVVRLQIERVPEQKEQLTFQVVFVGTVLVGSPEPEQVLLFDGRAGRDDQREDAGTKTAEGWREQVRELCAAHGLELRRGRYQT